MGSLVGRAWRAAPRDLVEDRPKRLRNTTVTADQALDVCLCYGWIDSLRRSDEGGYFLQRYSPRRPGSPWSKINAAKVETLLTAGRMRPAGLAEVAAAKATGRWLADLS